MAKEFLSQDEVDALLKGVSDEGEDDPAPADESGPRPYNLAKQERIVRGRMPALEAVHERCARLLRAGLYNFMRRVAEVSASPVKTQTYAEFTRGLVAPANLNVVHMKPLRGAALVVIEPTLVSLVIDTLFGGDGRFQARAEAREFTPTEQRISQRLLEVAFESLEQAWQPVCPLKFEYVRAETSAQFVNIATANEVVVTTTFSLDLGGEAGGSVHICIPYAMLEPIRQALFRGPPGEQVELDAGRLRMLSREVQSAEVQLTVSLCHATLALERVLGFKAGDVIGLDIPETVNAEVDGIPVMECRYGVRGGQYTLQVVRMFHPNAAEEPAAQPAAQAIAGLLGR